jgi:hypothetical protein
MHRPLLFSIISVMVFYSSCTPKPTASEQDQLNSDKIKDCLISYDWKYPSGDNPSGAWKFHSDQTFSYSSTLFGGLSTWGTWDVLTNEQILIHYTRTNINNIPEDQILLLSDCNSFTIGSTTYLKQ